MAATIAIVGRPNVGKSALFNRLVGRRIAIVHDQPGVTRDRVSAEAEWKGRRFALIDTGGIGLIAGEKTLNQIVKAALEQAELAIASADLICLVVDAQEGLVPLDIEVAQRLRASGKPVIIAANKADNQDADVSVSDFAQLGFQTIIPVSAIHGRGSDTLIATAMRLLPEPSAGIPETAAALDQPGVPGPLKLAVVGRPNVGKSSIINALTRSGRVIVSPIPGTTRDAVDIPLEVETDGHRETYVLIDTAGIRKPRRVGDSIEFFSVKRAEDSISRCDLAILIIDAEQGISEQDKKIGGRILEERKACIVVINKWDLMQEAVLAARKKETAPETERRRGGPKRLTTLAEFGQWVQENLFFLDYAPVIFTSAKSGYQLPRLLEAVRYVAAQLQQKIPTALLNRTLHEAIENRQPVSSAGHRLKFFYATQVKQVPPTFLLFVNRKDLMSDQYRKYLADQLRQAFGYEGCPLILIARARPKHEKPTREREKSSKR
jgi:GTP-binding protein